MLAGFLRARLQDNDGDRINVPMKCNLDREDCTSLRFPFILLYAWISRRDSCLVGVSCHIPSFWHCSRLASCVHHVYIPKVEMRKLKASEIILIKGQETLKLQSVNPKCPRNSSDNFGKSYKSNQNFGTFLRNYLGSDFKSIFYLNLELYS